MYINEREARTLIVTKRALLSVCLEQVFVHLLRLSTCYLRTSTEHLRIPARCHRRNASRGARSARCFFKNTQAQSQACLPVGANMPRDEAERAVTLRALLTSRAAELRARRDRRRRSSLPEIGTNLTRTPGRSRYKGGCPRRHSDSTDYLNECATIHIQSSTRFSCQKIR